MTNNIAELKKDSPIISILMAMRTIEAELEFHKGGAETGEEARYWAIARTHVQDASNMLGFRLAGLSAEDLEAIAEDMKLQEKAGSKSLVSPPPNTHRAFPS